MTDRGRARVREFGQPGARKRRGVKMLREGRKLWRSGKLRKSRLLTVLFVIGVTLTVRGQEIRSHYVSKAETDGTIYHTFPVTLFENPEAGELTFDLTYKEHCAGRATLNFTCRMERADPVDSVRFESGGVVMAGPVGRLYLEPEKRGWKHRYTFDLDAAKLCGFFDEKANPEVVLYIGGKPWGYRVKRSAWRSYAPVGYRIFEMIRVNEGH